MKNTSSAVTAARVERMVDYVEYVRGSEVDNWHWCKNCTQYPMYIKQRRFIKPKSKLCPQCKAKEDNKDCIKQIRSVQE